MKYAVGILLLSFLVGGVAYVYNHRQLQPNAGLPMKTITIGETSIQVEVASNDEQREQGLSDRTSLKVDHGMLFIFDPARKVGFWMKDMNFSIDMIFADEEGSVVKIVSNASPESYTDRQPPQTFPSDVPVRYVLEVPAGYANARGIAIGQKIVVQ
ncbi:hypothetical protein A2389_01620 [Candidatus Adlerbacteria bacterium RIFOXYB1_FULL_48_10]|nr:MAG: hypothetical protein A2389_01620 [Candidatus Adlerbacteria bacterium RIFOXYB1_FULL_48_10]OGC96540.1 MAG: hypothetical protein A2590_01100 [Candidatus Adlerbacteria bacterium RIFOXYD1_FULL_48_8]